MPDRHSELPAHPELAPNSQLRHLNSQIMTGMPDANSWEG